MRESVPKTIFSSPSMVLVEGEKGKKNMMVT